MWLLRRFPPVSGVFSPVLVAGSRCNNTTPPSLSSPSSQSSASKLNDSKPTIRDKHTVSAVRDAQYNTSTTNSISPSQQPFVSVATCCAHQSLLCCIISVFASRSFTHCQSEHRRGSNSKTSGFWPAGSSDKQRHCHQHIQTCWVCC